MWTSSVYSQKENGFLKSGQVIENWRLVKTISFQGNQSQTFKAEHIYNKKLGFFKATRTYYDELQRENDTLIALNQRLSESDQLKFPHIIVPFSKININNEVVYFIITQWVEGEPLSRYLIEKGIVPPALLIHFMDLILDLLDILHQHNIIHNDLHLGNVLIREFNQKITLVDFGWAYVNNISKEDEIMDILKSFYFFEWHMTEKEIKIWNDGITKFSSGYNPILNMRNVLDYFREHTKNFDNSIRYQHISYPF